MFLNKRAISRKGKINRTLFVLISIFSLYLLFTSTFKKPKNLVSESDTSSVKAKKDSIYLAPNAKKYLDVPLINQMDEPSLYNGCEVASLAMILNYIGSDVTKNELADSIPSVPFLDEDGLYGDPNDGFVGSISGESIGYSVYHQPVFALAQAFATKPENVLDLTGESFEQVLLEVNSGHPVWTIATVTYAPTYDMEEWETPNGLVDISWNVHSVVITGFDQENVYVNDPYGEKDKAVDRTEFQAAWEQMGRQAIIIS